MDDCFHLAGEDGLPTTANTDDIARLQQTWNPSSRRGKVLLFALPEASSAELTVSTTP